MTIKIFNENKEINIDVEKKNFESVEREIQLCLNGSYTYANIKDATGNSHYLTIGFLKNSYITILDDEGSKDADTLK
ncbi:hypothetical protein SAMN05421796_11071 [Chryseobacterium piscicola]|uniref:Uncharacterized protein n=1 Tax=Chryseobacterium piscicola TaxID=551459 RepID=A0A1N7P1E9_9FLAO|nr:hypothetical protein [Chryseobacterium piscicola]PQA92745.1 hypothetical protein B0A70_10190 [Chryseobacterium piscicola]SIT04384.1 hypothetical protein SAMN05421796_11071 [Chryseobacterium piscicola]